MGKKSKAASAVAQAIDTRQRAAHSSWARRHPERAAQERQLRLERRDLLARFAGKPDGTPETHAQASRKRQGALARLYESGAISVDQLGASQEIAAVAERIGADVTVRTVSLETRIDNGGGGDGTFFEALGQVRREVAYGRWRDELVTIARGAPVAAVLDMIVGDVGLTVVARTYRIHPRRARKLLGDALDLWPRHLWDAVREIDEATLLAAQVGLL